VTAPDEEKSVFTNSDRRLFVLSPKSMGLGSVKRSSQASKVASLRDSKETFSLPPLNENSVCLTSRSGINAEL
jgi:hypothetical protein